MTTTPVPRNHRRRILSAVTAAALSLTGLTALAAAPASAETIDIGVCPPEGEMPGIGNIPSGYYDSNVAVYAGGDFTGTGSAAESEGLLVVKGDATFDKDGGGTYNVGIAGVGSQIRPPADSVMLAVGGDLTVGGTTTLDIGESTGKAQVGGSVTGTVSSAGVQSGMGTADALGENADFGSVIATTSAQFAALPDNGDAKRSGGAVTLAGTNAAGYQVFSLDAADLDGASEYHFSDVTDIMPIVVNVHGGSTISVQANGTYLDGTRVDVFDEHFGNAASRILWNVVDATSLHLDGTGQFMGSVLAPNASADITLNTNGRLHVGGDIVTHGGGNEHHNYPWTGIHCKPQGLEPAPEPEVGSFQVRKALTGSGAGLVDPSTTFTVGFSYELDGSTTTDTLQVAPNQGFVQGPPNLPAGTEITFTENKIPSVDNVAFTGYTFSPASIVIGSGTVSEITLTNTVEELEYEPEIGGFQVRKVLDGPGAGLVDPGTPFTVTFSYELDGSTTTDTLEVAPDQGFVNGPQTLPAGTEITFLEAEIPHVDGAVFTGYTFSPASIVIGDGENTEITLTNTVEEAEVPVGGFQVRKDLTGAGADRVDPNTEFTVEYSYELDGAPTTGTLTVTADGEFVDGPQSLPVGTDVAFREIGIPSLDGVVFTGYEFSAPAITIGDGENTEIVLTNTAQPLDPADPGPDPEDPAVTLAETGLATTGVLIALGALLVAGTALIIARTLRSRRS